MKRSIRFWWILIWLCLFCLSTFQPVAAQIENQPTALVLEARGSLTPAMVNYLERGIRTAESRQVELVILRLDTPGGSIDLMNQIIQHIRSSDVPIVVYVAPNGAIAGSAGTLITLAGHKAAMAPETAIGAASPVGSQGEDIGETMEAKVKEIMKASARSLAERRGEDAVRLAESTIENSAAASASEALEANLIDYIARNEQDLLRQLDGVQVDLAERQVVLQTTGLSIERLELSFIEQTLQLLTNPNIVFLLLTVGVQAILIELSSPGGWVAGFIGAVALLLAVYGLGILPVNWFGIIFIILAFVLFVLEIKTPTVGALTVAGAGSFIAGALILFNSTTLPGMPRVSIPLVVGTGILLAASFSVIIGFAVRALRAPAQMGKETMIGKIGLVRERLDPTGTILLSSELWSAEVADPETSVEAGTQVEVVAVNGLRLQVRPVRRNQPSSTATEPV